MLAAFPCTGAWITAGVGRSQTGIGRRRRPTKAFILSREYVALALATRAAPFSIALFSSCTPRLFDLLVALLCPWPNALEMKGRPTVLWVGIDDRNVWGATPGGLGRMNGVEADRAVSVGRDAQRSDKGRSEVVCTGIRKCISRSIFLRGANIGVGR